MTIRVLESDVATKIAAGEVVERPLSVVKELLENSIDARASHITIDVAGGGTDLVRVTDDGEGIPADDLELAFNRHATSKIWLLSDLEKAETLGFRGEALPSIASVARVSLSSRTKDQAIGQEIHLRWGRVTSKNNFGRPSGTTVTVIGLFENVPARRKFLRSVGAETARISDMVSRLCLAFPKIQFRLRAEGRETLLSPGTGSLSDTIAAVYGIEISQRLVEARWELDDAGYQVQGYISTPSTHRANRNYMTFLVNQRWVRNRLLSYALEQSYRGFLPEKRFPIAVLNILVPANDLDVNIHPSKREVRLLQENRVFAAVQRAVRSSLISYSPVPEIRLANDRPSTESPTSFSFFKGSPLMDSIAGESHIARMYIGPTIPLSSLRIVGQVKNTYLVTEGPDGIYIIDQHAAHECVLYEEILKKSEQGSKQAHPLLDPVLAELTPMQEEIVRTNGELLERYGFKLEPFGDSTCLVRSVPLISTTTDAVIALQEVLDLITIHGTLKTLDTAIAASIACHSAVRAGKILSVTEIDELVHRLETTNNPHTCPHGRPTIVHLSTSRLEREFGRR
jgi:DNA mismatch repair protein MutL